MGINYYGVLGIKRTATDLEIKKAYRRLALEFNPNRLENDECAYTVFCFIGEAYEVLIDNFTRAVFDQYGEEGLKKGVPSPFGYIQPYVYHGNPMKTYRHFFGTTSPYADLLDYLIKPLPFYDLPEGKGVKQKSPPVKHALLLTLNEVYKGGLKKMKIQRLAFIDESEIITAIQEKILTVPIKPGLLPGTDIVFPEEGDQGPTNIPADVIFITEDRPHKNFKREDINLITEVTVSLEVALIGTTVTINTLDDRILKVPITDIITPTYEKIIEGEGMPIVDIPSMRGNLIIKFNVKFPEYLPRSSKKLITKAFKIAENYGQIGEMELINKLIIKDKIDRTNVENENTT